MFLLGIPSVTKQVKSKQRVADHGEVFTAEREVKAMCDLVKTETERIDSRFLEPACGDGNFLAEILRRKLDVVKKKYQAVTMDYERFSLLAMGSLYGVDIMQDNCEACRERLYTIWDEAYKNVCPKEINANCRLSARFILSRNIVCGNALSLMCVDENQCDTDEPIVFSEWTFPFNNTLIQRKDYSFAELLLAAEESQKVKDTRQLNLFANAKTKEIEPKLLKQYLIDYRELHHEHDK